MWLTRLIHLQEVDGRKMHHTELGPPVHPPDTRLLSPQSPSGDHGFRHPLRPYTAATVANTANTTTNNNSTAAFPLCIPPPHITCRRQHHQYHHRRSPALSQSSISPPFQRPPLGPLHTVRLPLFHIIRFYGDVIQRSASGVTGPATSRGSAQCHRGRSDNVSSNSNSKNNGNGNNNDLLECGQLGHINRFC